MKKTKIAMLLSLLLIPLTLLLGSKLQGRSYYLTSTLVLLEVMAPFFLSYEGRKPQARELVVVAVLCALAVAGRMIPIPHFKATFAVIMLAGVAFGPETGFLVGAMSAVVSNFYFGHGAHTPWQMFGYGAAGLIMGFAFGKGWVKRRPTAMALSGAVLVVLVIGPLLDTCTLFTQSTAVTWAAAGAVYLAGLPVNLSQAGATFLTLRFLGEPLLQELDRVKLRYGMGDGRDGT